MTIPSFQTVLLTTANKTPLGILSQPTYSFTSADFQKALGIPQLGYIIMVFGTIAAVVMIYVNIASLLVINNPMLASKTKTNIVRLAITLMVLRLAPLIADVALTIVWTALGVGGGTTYPY